MGCRWKGLMVVTCGLMVMVLSCTKVVRCAVDCGRVTSLISICSDFITYGAPEPLIGSPCCNSVVTLNNAADSPENRESVCRCLIGLITAYNPNATAMAALPGFCGISLDFTLHPNTDCNALP